MAPQFRVIVTYRADGKTPQRQQTYNADNLIRAFAIMNGEANKPAAKLIELAVTIHTWQRNA